MHQYINIFSQKIGAFPLFVGLGLFSIALLTAYILKKFKAKNEFETTIMVCIPLSLIFGCVTGYFSDVLFRGGLRAFCHPYGYGVTFYGWLLGTIFFYFTYAKAVHESPAFLLNCFLPSFSIAQAFGRIGCYLGGCCYGIPSKFFGVKYPPGSLPYAKYPDIPLLPIQIIESTYLIVIFLVLFKKIRFQDRASWYLLLVSAGRFFFEFLRGDNRGSLGISIFSPAQCISIVLFCIAIFIILTKKRRKQGGFLCRKKM